MPMFMRSFSGMKHVSCCSLAFLLLPLRLTIGSTFLLRSFAAQLHFLFRERSVQSLPLFLLGPLILHYVASVRALRI